MKSSLEKFGRKLTMHKSDGKEKRNHRTSVLVDELLQASKDIQDIRNRYDGFLSAAAAMTNSIYEFSESLYEVGTCLLDKTIIDADGERGRVLSTLGNIQSELQTIADTYRSYVIMTITNPSESLLAELRKVEEMKLQCDEKREAYQCMISQQREKGKLRNGKAEISAAQKLQEAQDEYNEVARLCVFRVKSLKEGLLPTVLTQATRHHAAQLDFFRKGFKALEEVDPVIRNAAEKHRIDCQLSEFDNGYAGVDEDMRNYEIVDDGELSFDYKQMEADKPGIPYLRVPTFGDPEMGHYKHQEEHHFDKQDQNSSFSAPIYPAGNIHSSEKPNESPTPRKVYSHVLPSPIGHKSPNSRSPTPVSCTSPFSKHEGDFGNDNTPTSVSTSIQLPTPSHSGYDNKAAKRQAYSGPLPPPNQFSGKIASTNGPYSCTELRRSVSPPPLSSPKISELHELPRPPGGLQPSKPAVSSGGAIVTRLPPPPLVVPRSFSIHSTDPSPQITVARPREVYSPPLTPISLSNMKSANCT